MSNVKAKRGPPTGGFISFSDVIGSTTAVVSETAEPSFASPSPMYTGDDVELSSVMKKMLKKDSSTRKKALIDMQSIIQSRGSEIVYAAVQHYVYVYSRLLLDNDRIVREQLNITLHKFCSICYV